MSETAEPAGDVVSCREAETKDWRAFNNLMPPGPFGFHITGEVQVPNEGVEATLFYVEPQGFNPKIVLLDLVLQQKPGDWPMALTWVQARYDRELPSGDGYEQAQILCEGELIADVPVGTTS